MKLLAHSEAGGTVTVTVRRWRWLWPVTETWIADYRADYFSIRCDKYFNFSHPFTQHRRWYDERGRVASCRLAVCLDAVLQHEGEFLRLRAAVERHYDDVIRIEDYRRHGRRVNSGGTIELIGGPAKKDDT